MQEFSKLFGAFNIADFIPWLGWIHANEFNRRLARARESLDGFIDTIIDDHLAKKRGNTERKLDGVEVESDMDIMFGGTETVASAIEWAMSELMKSPEDLKKVQQELSNKVGLTRFVHESDLENLTYLKICIKETLRLHPPIPLLLHETVEDSVVSRDPSAWEDPDTFKPSRFLNDGARGFKGNAFEYIPFGSGRRSCPGIELDMEDMFGLTAPRAIGLVAVPSYRLSFPLRV
ncbi:hypothetical protein EZV62_011640 [Acer yangbiense]|uniref:Cytochrome P450 n=1 Tax=Acer yangbiense TaxID=1000413 RepID=A0A5C7I879_9ROSI|nr:hypothetical protein EZV62_011640 [Acer yangbiense]